MLALEGHPVADVYEVDLEEGAPEWSEGRKWVWHEAALYLFPAGWRRVAQLRLTPGQAQVLYGVLARLTWGNRCQVSAAQIGRDVGLTRSAVAKQLKVLASYQLLYVENLPGQQTRHVLLSPLLCWKGRPWQVAHARAQFLAAWRLRYGDDPGTGSVRLPGARRATLPSPTHAEPPPGGSTLGGAGPLIPHPQSGTVGSF